MKKRSLLLLILFSALNWASSAFAEVVINGTTITQITLNGQTVSNLSFVQNGSVLTITSGVNACADPEAASCPGSAAFCAANPTNVACPGSSAFCAAHPTD